MTAKEALTKLTVMLGLNTPEVATETVEASSEANVEVTETEEVQFAEAQLVDGTVVMTEGELAVGAVLYVVTEEGNVLAPEGMHETTDGYIVTVDADGVILSIEEKAAEEAPVVEEAPVEAAEANFSEDLVKSIFDLIAPALNEINSLKEELATLQANFSEFKDEPAGKKITNNLTEFKQAEQSFTDSRFEALKKIRGGK
jgi:hypothetical protein